MNLLRPKMPAIPETPKAPTVDDAIQAEEDIARLRKRRGLASTFLVGQRQRASAAAASLMGYIDISASNLQWRIGFYIGIFVDKFNRHK